MDEVDCCEAIAALNPRAVDTTRIVVQQSDRHHDVIAEIIGRLARCSIQASCLARLKYADMQEQRPLLINMLIDKYQRTENRKILQCIEFAELAVMEVCDPRACRWCRGVRWFPETDQDGKETGRRITCAGCGGDGEHKWLDKDRMERLRLPEKDWKNNHMGIYSKILGTVWEWDREVRDAMMGNLTRRTG